MLTLMPVAAFADETTPADAGVASDNTSYVYTEDSEVETDETAKIELDLFSLVFLLLLQQAFHQKSDCQ